MDNVKEIIDNLNLIDNITPNYVAGRRMGLTDEESESKPLRAIQQAMDILEKQTSDGLINLKTISLPELNGLKPTLESTALKITEENGELCRAIGKFRGLSGEKEKLDNQAVYREIIRELLDVAQTAFTMMFLLEKEHDIDISEYIDEHIEKLINKGYIKTE